MIYKSKKCEICKEELNEHDDIVVCPECGAPYHRECYEKIGNCIYADKHGTDGQWHESDGEADKADTNESGDDNTDFMEADVMHDNRVSGKKVCKACGNVLRDSALFCDRCGTPVAYGENTSELNSDDFGAGKMIYPQIELVDLNDEMDDGVTFREVSDYVKVNKQYYMFVFSRIKRFKLSRFNFMAFLFTGGWMMYRKQYVKGAIIAAVICILMLASGFIYSSYSAQILAGILESAGVENLTVSSVQTLYPYIEQLAKKDLSILLLPYIIELVRFGIMITVGIRANKSYLKHCVKQVRRLKDSAETKEQAQAAISSSGGVNPAIAICMAVCYMIIKYLPPVLMQ